MPLWRRVDRGLPLTSSSSNTSSSSMPLSPSATTRHVPTSRRQIRSHEEASRNLIIMAQNHLLCFVIFFGSLIMVTRAAEMAWNIHTKAQHKRGMVPISKNQVTIVTAYFDIPAKRPSSEYLPWIKHMMTLDDNMVIFTSPDQVQRLQILRGNRKTLIVPMQLNETTMVQHYGMEFWEYQNKAEPTMEKYLHTKELYIVWNEKAHFLRRAMEANPFSTDFFAWVDIGYLRNDLLDYKRMIQYVPNVLQESQVMLLDVRELVGKDYLGGGFIGGYRTGLSRWTQEYYKVLDDNKDRFIGKDQPWMFRTCATHPELCILIEPNGAYGDPWFHMAPYLHGVQFYGPLDHLRRVWDRSFLNRCILWWTEPNVHDDTVKPNNHGPVMPFEPEFDPDAIDSLGSVA